MSDLTPELVDEVVAACQAQAAEIGDALSRALDAPIEVAVGKPGTLDSGSLPDDLTGPALTIVLSTGSQALLMVLPESCGLVPGWCAEPDPTGQSKLSTLALELGELVLPESVSAEDRRAGRVEDAAAALMRAGAEDGAAILALELSGEDKRGTARLLWPATRPNEVLVAADADESEASPFAEGDEDGPREPIAAPEPKAAEEPSKRGEASPRDLPDYARSLMRIKVPVVVTLAAQRKPVSQIVELGPGSIIQFDKSCEEMLDLAVGNHEVAVGEAVKVGDKFGLRITSIKLPEERFQSVRPRTS